MCAQDLGLGGTGMSSPHEIPAELAEWIVLSLDGRITPEEFAQLEHELATNEAALPYYLEFVTLSVGLIERVGVLPKSLEGISDMKPEEFLTDLLSTASKTESGHDSIRFKSEISEDEKTRLIEQYAQAQLNAFLLDEQETQQCTYYKPRLNIIDAAHIVRDGFICVTRAGMKIAKRMAVCMIMLLALLIVFIVFKGDPKVAIVKETVEARWADSVETGIELSPQQLQLQEGYARIQLKRGAEVIVQAPATFELKAENRMFLKSGSITARVPEPARGFRIDTSQSHIVDYGTEFGVLADNDGCAEVHVFAGQVGLGLNTRENTQEAALLEEGQAALVDHENHITQVLVVDRPRLFTRTLSQRKGYAVPGRRLSLVDIVGGGNGLGTGYTNVFVDPNEGYVKTLYSDGKGNEYHTLTANPFIDGLFIPDGRSQQVVSSQGHVFSDCPETNGECHANLGVTPKPGVWAWTVNSRTGIVRFDGQTYGNPSNPFLMMHANLGITFDLNAIRALCPGIGITQFVAQTGIADFEEPASCNADFWVLVDGQVRASRRNVTLKGVLSDMSVVLKPSDRFLTLITTDGGDIDRLGDYQRSYRCDWCVFVKPVLLLDTGEGHHYANQIEN
jgi:hypothetical protein